MNAAAPRLLTSVQMAEFVANGFLRFPALVPDHLNRTALDEIAAGRIERNRYAGHPLAGLWSNLPGMGGVLALPEVRGMIQSLVGRGPRYDHHAIHTIPAMRLQAQPWHADATIDTRPNFDVQLFYYPQETTREMGGTLFLPGSHFRRIHEYEAAVHQNFAGQERVVCPAGTVLVAHHGIWHCGQPNRTDQVRHMVKLRLNPTEPQVRLWDTSDLADPAIPRILSTRQPWLGAEHRLEIIQRIRLWRLLTGDPEYDFDMWMGRLESAPLVATG